MDMAAARPAADPAAQLVQLRQAEAIGAPDDHRVRTRHVEPGLDDVGRQQDVAVADGEARPSPRRSQPRAACRAPGAARVRGRAFQARPPSSPCRRSAGRRRSFARRGPLSRSSAVRTVAGSNDATHGADRLAPRRRSRDDRQLLEPDQRMLQRARDRGRAHRQEVAAPDSARSLALSAAPKRCSSSMITRARS